MQRLQYAMVRTRLIEETARNFENARPDLQPLVELLEVARRHQVKVVLAATPSVDLYRDTAYYRLYRQQFAEIEARYADLTRRIDFPQPFIAGERFVDQIHYDCPTAAEVNAAFHEQVMPRILEFAPPPPD